MGFGFGGNIFAISDRFSVEKFSANFAKKKAHGGNYLVSLVALLGHVEETFWPRGGNYFVSLLGQVISAEISRACRDHAETKWSLQRSGGLCLGVQI